MSRLEDFLTVLFVLAFIVPTTIGAFVIRPVYFLFDRRKYRYPYNPHGYDPLGLWYPFCILHYALKEDGRCPNCGIKKQDLIKSKRSEL